MTEKKEMEGLGIGVSNMKSGERSLLRVGWELGYGKEGSFSFPNVPPMADIIYEIELIGYDETKEVCALLTSLITQHFISEVLSSKLFRLSSSFLLILNESAFML